MELFNIERGRGCDDGGFFFVMMDFLIKQIDNLIEGDLNQYHSFGIARFFA
jgi:hypothetical protein